MFSKQNMIPGQTTETLTNIQRKIAINNEVMSTIKLEISLAKYAMDLTRNELKRKYPPTAPVYKKSRIEDYEQSIIDFDKSLATTITADTPGQYLFGAGIQRVIHPQPPNAIFQDYRTPPPEETTDEWCEMSDPVFMSDIDTDLQYLTMLSDLDLDSMDLDFGSEWEELGYSTDEDEFMHLTVFPDS